MLLASILACLPNVSCGVCSLSYLLLNMEVKTNGCSGKSALASREQNKDNNNRTTCCVHTYIADDIVCSLHVLQAATGEQNLLYKTKESGLEQKG